MSLPPEKTSELKQIIQSHLKKINIHGKIQEVLAETARVDPGSGRLSEEDFRRALQRRGIIDDVMKDLRFSQVFLPLTDRSHVRNEESCLYSEKTEELSH
uniref:CEP76 N-terminal domain-containing protein n=1 Tax=Oryzias sinensis TaxID=183150 RepID=A0A8C7X1E3_9TELE